MKVNFILFTVNFLVVLCLGIMPSHVDASMKEANSNVSIANKTITVENSSKEYSELEQIKRTAEENGISLEQALDHYVDELVQLGFGGAYEGNTNNNENKDLPSLPQNITIDGMTLDELEDLKWIAKEEGISFAEAIDHFGWQNEFVHYADKMEKTFPDLFAGAVFNSDGEGSWIAFKEEVPEVAIQEAATLPKTVTLIGSRGYTEFELKSELETVHDFVYHHDDIQNAQGYYDIEKGIITIEAVPKATLSTTVKNKLLSELQNIQLVNPRLQLEINFVKHIESDEDSKYIRGGGLLDNCTAGFTLRNSSGGRGISTAAHCKTSPYKYRNHSGDGGWTMIYRQRAHSGTYGDLARYSVGSKTATRTFYYDWNKKRYATAVASPRVGISVCNFGKTTGRTCSTVYKLNTTRGIYKGLTATKKSVTDHGDSGGPWYYGGTAYGVHSGRASIWLVSRSQFSPAVNLPSAVGMRVNTN